MFRPAAEPLIDCVLQAGDVLYSPALFPHEGETILESVSLSLAWQGVSPYDILAGMKGPGALRNLDDQDDSAASLFTLIPDILPVEDTLETIHPIVMAAFATLGDTAPTEPEVKHYLASLLSKNSISHSRPEQMKSRRPAQKSKRRAIGE